MFCPISNFDFNLDELIPASVMKPPIKKGIMSLDLLSTPMLISSKSVAFNDIKVSLFLVTSPKTNGLTRSEPKILPKPNMSCVEWRTGENWSCHISMIQM